MTELPLVPEEDGWEYQTMRYGEEEVSTSVMMMMMMMMIMMMMMMMMSR